MKRNIRKQELQRADDFFGKVNDGFGRTVLRRKRQDQFKPVMDVEDIVGITAEIIESFRADKGQMILPDAYHSRQS